MNDIGFLETYTNQYGEQWWYDYDEHIGLGILWGADVDYHKYIVINGYCPALILDRDEREWLMNVWRKHLK